MSMEYQREKVGCRYSQRIGYIAQEAMLRARTSSPVRIFAENVGRIY